MSSKKGAPDTGENR